MKALTLLFFSVILTTGFTCYNCEEQRAFEMDYRVALPYDKTVYQVGDTINLYDMFPAELTLNDGKTFDNGESEFGYSFDIIRVLPDEVEITRGIDYFQVINRKGSFLRGGYNQQDKIKGFIKAECDRNQCEIDVHFVPQIPGVFGFMISNGFFFQQGNSECESHTLTDLGFTSGINNNYRFCYEIGTERLFIDDSPTGRIYINDLDKRQNMYFIRVE
ncbi:MAG: hypothetical protein IPN29_06575 [Saprospiraceae bacterium]|nr:hypothetical protein [Saprospiraceae bacterium]